MLLVLLACVAAGVDSFVVGGIHSGGGWRKVAGCNVAESECKSVNVTKAKEETEKSMKPMNRE